MKIEQKPIVHSFFSSTFLVRLPKINPYKPRFLPLILINGPKLDQLCEAEMGYYNTIEHFYLRSVSVRFVVENPLLFLLHELGLYA